MIPHWAVLGLLASLASTAVPLLQEKMKADGLSVAVIVKLVAVISMIPFLQQGGFPDNPRFYLTALLTSALWAVSDVIYFRAVPVAGAGVVSRLLPAAVILSFLLWFAFDPGLLHRYAQQPVQAALIALIVIAAAGFAAQLSRCPVSWRGVRLVWFVIFAASVGPLIEKITLGYAKQGQAAYAFTFIQSLFMLGFWGVFILIRRQLSYRRIFARDAIKAGIPIGIFSAAAVTLRFLALQETEHPAYLSVILFTDALWILLVHRMLGKRDGSNIMAGLGIVGCAIALVLVKSLG